MTHCAAIFNGNRVIPIHTAFIPPSSGKCYAFITAMWIGMLALAQPWGEFPLNDDWVYALAVKSVLTNGYYQFPSPSSANVGPQVYWGALFCLPFGFSYGALRVSTMVLGWLGVIYLFRLIRQLTGDKKSALVAAMALAVNPLYFGLAASFMTDVPFVALSVVAAYYVISGLRLGTTKQTAVGVALCFVVIMIRQLGLAVLIGFAVAYLLDRRFTMSRLLKMVALLVAAASMHIGYQYWMVHSGRTPVVSVHSDLNQIISRGSPWWVLRFTMGDVVSYAGFFFLPVAALFWVGPLRARGDRTAVRLIAGAAGVLFLLMGTLVSLKGRALPSAVLSSVLIPSGFGPLTLRDTFVLNLNQPSLPAWMATFWIAFTFLALLSFCTWAYQIGIHVHKNWKPADERCIRQNDSSIVFVLASAAAYVAVMLYASTRFPVFDRYYLFLAPLLVIAAFLLDSRNRSVASGWRLWISTLFISVCAAFSVAATHDYVAWSRARWTVLDRLVNVDKIDARLIDGGYEFNGSMLYAPGYKVAPTKSWWWVEDDEYVIASGPIPGYSQFRRYDFQRWLPPLAASIFVLRRSSPPR